MKTSTKFALYVSWLLWGALACASSVGKANNGSYRLRFLVRTGLGTALSDARITVDKQVVGVTDPMGWVTTQWNGREGQEVRVLVQCPKGYRGPSLPESVRLNKTRALDDTTEQAGTLVELTCESERRDVVVVVRAQGGGTLPLRIGTQSAGVTDAQGNAQLLARLDRDQTTIEVGIDTESKRELLPRNPSRTFSVGRNDAIVVYSEQLVAEKRKVKGRTTAKPPRVPPRPIRLD